MDAYSAKKIILSSMLTAAPLLGITAPAVAMTPPTEQLNTMTSIDDNRVETSEITAKVLARQNTNGKTTVISGTLPQSFGGETVTGVKILAGLRGPAPKWDSKIAISVGGSTQQMHATAESTGTVTTWKINGLSLKAPEHDQRFRFTAYSTGGFLQSEAKPQIMLTLANDNSDTVARPADKDDNEYVPLEAFENSNSPQALALALGVLATAGIVFTVSFFVKNKENR